MGYIGQLVVFLSALVAIKGETWNKKAKGIKKVTSTGIITIIFALIGLVISILNTRLASVENTENRIKIENTQLNTKIAKEELQKANGQIDSLNAKLLVLNSQLFIYQDIISQIKNQSDRQDQTVMMQFVQLGPHDSWISPSLIYSGSRIQFLGFEDSLIVEYGGRIEIIPEWDGRHAIESVIMGESGRGFRIRLYNNGYKDIMGKVHVISSPRIRSTDWSWIEEKLSKFNSKTTNKTP